MTIKELKKITSNLPEDTVVFIEENNVNEVETIEIRLHSDGRAHLILSVID